MGELLWLEPVRSGFLPTTSIFYASGKFVLSTFVVGTFNPLKRPDAYKKMVDVLLRKVKQSSLGELRIKHSNLSREILGTNFPPYSLSQPPHSLSAASTFPDILDEQEMLHGSLEKDDKLKLIFHAIYGGEHLFFNSRMAWQKLVEEWESLDVDNNEPLAERISPDGDIYRLNLKPAKELGIELSKLYQTVKESAEMLSKDLVRRELRLKSQVRSIGFETEEVPSESFHHSSTYRQRVRPAYRLIHVSKIEELIKTAD